MIDKNDTKTTSKLEEEQKIKKRKLYQQINHLKRLKQNQAAGSLKLKNNSSQDNQRIQEPGIIQPLSKENHPVIKIAITNQKKNPKETFTNQLNGSNQNLDFIKLEIADLEKNVEKKDKEKIEIIKPKNQIKDLTKRTLDRLVFSQQLQNQSKNIEKQRKKIKMDSPDSLNISTCIEISSSSDEQNGKNINKQISAKFQQQLKEKEDDLYKKEHPLQTPVQLQHSLNQMFSKIKLNYVRVNPQLLSRLRKQKKRLEDSKTELKISNIKVNFQSSYVSVAKTVPIQFILEKIIQKEWIFEQIKQYRFSIFKGSIQSFQQTVWESIQKGDFLIDNAKIVYVPLLYDWYTLSHVLSSCSNIVLIVERAPVIKNFYCMKCRFCQKICMDTCLCLKFWVCRKKPCCQQALKQIQKHEIICKYSSPYKASSIRAQFNSGSRRGVVGLINCQNSCFMNTALQCLAACEPLTEYFIEKEHLKNINYGNHLGTFGQISTRYGQFLQQIFTTTRQVLELDKFKRSVFRWDNKYLLDQQEDSQEFLIQLLDWLKEDLNMINVRPEYTPSEFNSQETVEQKANKAWKNHLARNNSIIQFLMAGVIKSGIQCLECLYQSHSFETFLTLPLPVVKSQPAQRWTFDIKVCVIYANFRKKNEAVTITLESFGYEDALKQIKRVFSLSNDSQLIGVAHQSTDKANRIINSTQGSHQIAKSKQDPSHTRLLFLEYTRQQLEKDKIEVQFQLKFNQNKKWVTKCCPRYLFFSKDEGSTPRNLFRKLLVYFYKIMFKNTNKIPEEQYLNFYLTQQNVPFRVFLQKQKLQILIQDQICLINHSEVVVIFQNEETFSSIQLLKAALLSRPVKNQNIYKQENSKVKMSIYDCFKEFQKSDIMHSEDSWHCPNCNEKRTAFKKMSIYKAPQIFILFFKRFASSHGQYSHRMKKLQTFVDFPHLLDLNDYVQKQELPYTHEKKELKYRLFAVANHLNLGSNQGQQSGHYTAYINNLNDWYRINDEKIEPMGHGDICTKNAYILFYSRI